ncbi:MAG: DNA polymerase I, partial [Sedimentisphaerales bacterium]
MLLYRRLRYGYAFYRIPLTKGQYTIVDPDDYRRLSKHKWYATVRHGNGHYAVRSVTTKNSKRSRIYMHREVINVPDNLLVDHINHNKLDNRKANLRPATTAQNTRNQAKRQDRTFSSKYKGVTWRRDVKCWQAKICVNVKPIYLGIFDSENRAAKAYDRAARRYHGEFAVLNFPEPRRPVARIVPFLAGVFLEFLACFSNRYVFCQSQYAHPSTSPASRFAVIRRLWLPHIFRFAAVRHLRLPHVICQFNWVVPHPLGMGMAFRRQTTKHQRLITTPPLTVSAQTPKVAAMAKKLYIIDGHAHIYAAYYAPMGGQLTGPSGEPTKAAYIFTMAILGLIQRRKPEMLVVAMDSKAPTFRKEMYSEYKANRKEMPEDLPGQIGRIEQILEAMNIPMLRLDGFEADDIIGTLAKKAGADGYECLICSKDKDLLQLIDEHISTFDIKTDTLTDVKAMFEKMGIRPEQFIDCLALQGDTSDNVPGVPDVGPKTALGWIQKYGSLENLYENVDEIKGKRGDNLRMFKEQAELSKKLVTIDCNVPVDVDYDNFELSKYNEPKLKEIFTELGFNRLLAQLGLTAEPSLAETTSSEEPTLTKTADHDYQLVDTPEKFEKFYEELKEQKLFAIDTETTSIHAMRADLVGMSFSWQEGHGFYLPVKVPLGSKHLQIEAVRQKLAPILADESVKKIGQNIKYDMLVLRNAQMPIKGVHFDTMVASYCLDPGRSHSMNNMAADFLDYECIPISALIGKGKNQLTFDLVDTAAACEYAAEDADVTYRLYLYLKGRLEKEPLIKKLFEEVEMPLVPVLATMEYSGVSLDTKVLRKMSGEISETLKTVTEQIYEQTGTVFNLDSPKQLGEVLFDKLGLVPVRGRSTDAGVLEQLSDQHPAIDPILQYRGLSKLQNTYVDKLGSLINPRTERVHASLNQTITATGRLSSSNPNLQNIPIRTELGSKVRSAFVPGDKNNCILSADYSQIELRLLAHLSKDRALMEAFAADRDIHRFVASQIYGVPIEEVTNEMRSRSKAVNFGIIYGQG